MPSHDFTPSVTRVIADMGMAPDFEAPYLANNAKVIEARDRGHRIHALLQALLANVSHDQSYRDDELMVAIRVADWLRDHGYTEIVAVEQRRTHRTLRYNGQPDVIARNPETGRYVVIDLKTGSLTCEWHEVQAAAYAELFLSELDPVPSRLTIDLIIIYANARSFAVHRVKPADHMRAWQAWQDAIRLWHWRNKAGMLPARRQAKPAEEPKVYTSADAGAEGGFE